jgi:hypothetical protein
MTDTYAEVGGIRFGTSYWGGWNATWPFAKLEATRKQIEVTVRGIVSTDQQFLFPKSEILRLQKRRGLFSTGLQIQHSIPRYSPFILFWTFRYAKLRKALNDLGYSVVENHREEVQQSSGGGVDTTHAPQR